MLHDVTDGVDFRIGQPKAQDEQAFSKLMRTALPKAGGTDLPLGTDSRPALLLQCLVRGRAKYPRACEG